MFCVQCICIQVFFTWGNTLWNHRSPQWKLQVFWGISLCVVWTANERDVWLLLALSGFYLQLSETVWMPVHFLVLIWKPQYSFNLDSFVGTSHKIPIKYIDIFQWHIPIFLLVYKYFAWHHNEKHYVILLNTSCLIWSGTKASKDDLAGSGAGDTNNTNQPPPAKLLQDWARTPLPHVCPYCGKTFTRRVFLRTHVYSHTGEKLFTCKVPVRKPNQSVPFPEPEGWFALM